EVQTAGQLANDEDVDAFEALGAQRRAGGELGERAHRAEVGPQAERLAQPEQALLGADLGGRVVPGRAADGAEQHGVGAATGGERVVGERRAVGVDRCTADQALIEREAVPEQLADRVEDAARLVHDFGADAITREQDDRGLHACASMTCAAGCAAVAMPNSMPSASAVHVASRIEADAPTVDQPCTPSVKSMRTRVTARVPALPSRMRTL